MSDYYYELNDTALLVAWRNGDTDAAVALMERHRDTVLRFLAAQAGFAPASPALVWGQILAMSPTDLVRGSVPATVEYLYRPVPTLAAV